MNILAYKNANNPETVEAFKAEMFKEFGVVESPKTLELFDRAWKHGHEGGFEEVYYHFGDLLDMLEDASGQI